MAGFVAPGRRLDRLVSLSRLGPNNLFRVGLYRLGLKLRLHRVLRLSAANPSGPFFSVVPMANAAKAEVANMWRHEGLLFGFHHFAIDGPPDWHANPLRPALRAESAKPWWTIPDFTPEAGDIKVYWDISRMNWLSAFAQQAMAGDATRIDRINEWLSNWCEANPPYLGVNWKCGQEASIRVFNLAMTAMVLDQWQKPMPALVALLKLHLQRIAPTISYALGQQNNHGTSEAAALYIGGSWLARLGDAQGFRWQGLGRKWLENRAAVLLTNDGRFSQYSSIYHRLMLDTYCLAEIWRRKLGLDAFSTDTTTRLKAATNWLYQMADLTTGDAPNYGANDGTMLFNFGNSGYRDFRPTLQTAAVLFCEARAMPAEGPWDAPLRWMDMPLPTQHLPLQGNITFSNGGQHLLRQGNAMAVMHFPQFKFRPGQCDGLHVDLWQGGRALIRDSGSYSYNAPDGQAFDLEGVAAHATVQFDNREQMPRLGRFLLGSWLKTTHVSAVVEDGTKAQAGAAYVDGWGAMHHRNISLTSHRLTCVDQLGGKAKTAVLRWQLAPGNWRVSEGSVSNGQIKLSVSGSEGPCILRLRNGWQSLNYLDKSATVVVEVETPVPTSLTTVVDF